MKLSDGTAVPALGQGTWMMGDDRDRLETEREAIVRGIDLGLTLIDTAEMYGGGASERLVGQAIAGRRDEIFLVSKVLPSNAGGRALDAACEASLERLGTDRLDLYLLHWPGSVPLEETVEGFERLKAAGKIERWGVSNVDAAGMAAFDDVAVPPAVNQVQYSLAERGIEFDLLPDLAARGIPAMAYCPLGRGGAMLADAALATIADKHGVAASAVALAFTLYRGDVIAIPKASRVDHVAANAAALDIVLDDDDLKRLDAAFPPPVRAETLAIV